MQNTHTPTETLYIRIHTMPSTHTSDPLLHLLFSTLDYQTMMWSCDPNDGETTLQHIEDLTTHAKEVQQMVLSEILARNRNTEYLHGFMEGRDDVGCFKEKVPIVEYEQVKPYINRIANGEPSSLICAEPITEFHISSGTSGGIQKMMPTTAEDLDRKTYMHNLLIAVINKYVEGLDKGKAMYLMFVTSDISTPSGLMARPSLTSYYKSPNFRRRPFNKYAVYTSPDATILCPDSSQSMYCQLLCGLVQRRDVLRVGAVFASVFLRAIKYLKDNWRSLCSDIRTGRLSHRITDIGCRDSVADVLVVPDPKLADDIESICGGESWEGVVRKLWPETKYVDVIVTGSMAQYIPMLEFYSGGLPLLSKIYGSSESFLGINMEPLRGPREVAYTLVPNMAYFEFLEVDGKGEEAAADGGGAPVEVVDLVDVKVGRYYELLVTTFTGLYRFRVGDVLLVTGFYNNTPQFRFAHRRDVILSVDIDKTNEDDLLRAVTAAKPNLGSRGLLLAEYTSYVDTSSFPGHYVLFWELTTTSTPSMEDPMDPTVMSACCEAVEEALDSVYRKCRNQYRSVGPLEIRVVGGGAFDTLMDFRVARGSSVNQYKTPRCLKSREAVELLDARVVGRFFSRRPPEWQPPKIGGGGGDA